MMERTGKSIQFIILGIVIINLFITIIRPLKYIRGDNIVKVAAQATAYNPLPKQTDSTPEITAIGTKVREDYTVAVSPDLLKEGIVAYGDIIYVYELGKFYSVEDRMHERFKKRIDIFIRDKKVAQEFGLQIVHFSIFAGKTSGLK